MMNQEELRQTESRCIQEHAPACMAACPIHVDVRGMIAAIQQKDFSGGLKLLQKTVPFPGIISHICDQPCQGECKRNEAGGAIEIVKLEKACVKFGEAGEGVRALPPKSKRVAVIGGGLSGMTLAYDLARKGYPVTIYEARNKLGGRIWEFPPEQLPVTVILKDIEILEKLRVEIILNTRIEKIEPDQLTLQGNQFDAIFLAAESETTPILGLSSGTQDQMQIDPITYMTTWKGIFAAGHALRSSRSPIFSVMDGRRAAISIDRYLQNVSLVAARYNEGVYSTRLYTNMQGIPSIPTVKPANPQAGYTQDEAVLEAQRCIICQCLECVKVCEYLKHYGGYPKKYIREIYNNLSIVMGTRYSNKFVNSCSLCGLCAQVCPESLDMGSICKEARQVMVQQNRMPPSAHDFALRDMAFSNSDKFSMARNQPGSQTSQYAFFPGCQLSASFPEYVHNIYAYLREQLNKNHTDAVGLILRCCGAPADWAGRLDLFEAAKAEFLLEYEKMNKPKLIVACSSCYQVFKTHFPDVEIVSLWEMMDKIGLPAGRGQQLNVTIAPLAIHDPCSTRHENNIQDSARNILNRLGYSFQELPLNRDKTECCSYGGLMWLANPELAAEVTRRRIAESSYDYVTYCAMCRDFFVRQGKPTLHLLDLIYAENLEIQSRQPAPGYSQRHENRARLKRNLLKQIWGEDMDSDKSYENIRLIITPEIQALLDERLILIEDIQQVIEYAERTGKKLLNKKTNGFLAYYKPAAVTYWVEYSTHGEAFMVHRAYSHRMQIGEEAKK